MIFSMIGMTFVFGIYFREILIRRPGFLLYHYLFVGLRDYAYIHVGASLHMKGQGRVLVWSLQSDGFLSIENAATSGCAAFGCR